MCPLRRRVVSHAHSLGLAFALLLPACAEPSAPDHVDVGAQSAALHSVCATTPAAMQARGFDVSKWQGAIDWTKVANAGFDFVFVRSTSGATYVDPRFAENFRGARDAGLLRGPYHYFDVSVAGEDQADSMLDTVGTLEDDDLPPVVDVEDEMSESPATIVARVRGFVDRVRTRSGRTPILYSGGHFWDTYVVSAAFADVPFWTAHWFTNGTTTHCPNTPDAWPRWTFWQYTNTGTVAGIAADVDLDVFDGTPTDLLEFVRTSSVVPRLDGGVPPGDDGGSSDAGSGADADVADASDQVDAGLDDAASTDDVTAPRRRHGRGCAVAPGARRPSSAHASVLAAIVLALVLRSRRSSGSRPNAPVV